MKYTLENGKVVNVPDKMIQANMKCLKCSQEEAIKIYLEEEGVLINEELEKLDNFAKNQRVVSNASGTKKKTITKPVTKKVSDEKQVLFEKIKQFLEENYENVEILKENKLFSIQIAQKTFKIDLIEQRTPKN